MEIEKNQEAIVINGNTSLLQSHKAKVMLVLTFSTIGNLLKVNMSES